MILLSLLACGGDYAGPLTATELFAGGSAPNRVHLTFELRDADGRPVTDWTPDELSFSEDGTDPGATVRTWDDLDPEQPLVLLIDVSSDGAVDEAVTLAQGILDARDPQQPVRLLAFSDSVTVLKDWSTDAEALDAALAGVEPGSALTDLNSALVDALDDYQDDLRPQTGYTRGAVVVLTDWSSDVCSLPTGTAPGDVLEARGDKVVIGLALNRGAANALGEFASGGVAWGKDASEADAILSEGLALIEGARQALVFASWCSDARDGLAAVEATFKRGGLGGTLATSVDATGLADSSPFDAVSPLPEPVEGLNARILGDVLYLGGGDEGGSTFYARVLDDGRLGTVRLGPVVDLGESARMHVTEGAMWLFNGQEGVKIPLVEGVPGTPESVESPPYADVVVSDGDTLFSVEGRAVYAADVNDLSWTQHDLPEGLDGYIGAAVAQDRLYVYGSWRASIEDDYQLRGYSASLSDLDTWADAGVPADYPGYWFEVAAVGDQLVLFPGDDGDSTKVWAAQLRLESAVWTEAGALSTDRRFYGVAAAPDRRLYLMGGELEGSTSAAALVTRLSDESTLALDCVP